LPRRREVLKSALTLAATSALGTSPLWWAERARAAARIDWDFIIVGGGTAGIPAAIFAARRGAKVLVIDAAGELGGTLHLASGQIAAANTHLQRAQGIVDSPDAHYDDVMRLTHGHADPAIIRLTVENAPATLNWLLDAGLVPLPDHPVTGDELGRPAYRTRRYFWGKDAGRSIMAVLLKELAPELARGRVVAQLNTRATSLMMSDAGAVEGVRAHAGDAELAFRGRDVLLTSGGYAMNPQAYERFCGFPLYAAGSYPYSQGDGLELAVSAGGWLRGRELHRAGTGSILSSDRFPAQVYGRFETTPQLRLPWEIWVNDDGRRFIREDEPLVNARGQALLRQPKLRYQIVFDDAIFRAAPPGVHGFSRERMLEHFNVHPMFHRADSLEALAAKAGMDAAALGETVGRYNAGVRRRSDELGREHLPMEILKPPFHAITHLGQSATSSVGVVVDAALRVLRGNGAPVPNLYAAGEVLGSGVTVGDTTAPGMMITPALTCGKWLGDRLPLGTKES
jgi:fumarate reductase flavoprotein subunit